MLTENKQSNGANRHRAAVPLLAAILLCCAALSKQSIWAKATPAAATRSAAPATVMAPVPPAVYKWLRSLDERGQTLHNFSADIRMSVHHLRTDEKDINIGRIWYQTLKGRTRFDIRFNVLVVDGAIARRHANHDIVFDGRWLIDRDGAAKIYRKVQVAPPGLHYDPLKLGQGPIPIPIGQSPAAVEKNFTVSLVPAVKADAGLIHLKLVPIDAKAFTFKRLELWIDPKLDLPVRILRIDPDSTPTLAVLTKVNVNGAMHHDFHVRPPPANAGWTIDIQRH